MYKTYFVMYKPHLTDRQKRVAPFICFKCCGLLGTLERNSSKEGERCNLKFTITKVPPPLVMTHFEGRRRTKQMVA